MDYEGPRVSAIRSVYDGFDAPVTAVDCGQMCAPHNPSGKPFCCDICHATPAAYHTEWRYLSETTDLWHVLRGDECGLFGDNVDEMRSQTPDHMILLACLGPAHCQRDFRAVSCRQFPFFPYITSDGRFLGLAYEWEFEAVCWVISNLGLVSRRFREEFLRTYDRLFDGWGPDFKAYYLHSEVLREHFAAQRRTIPLLHRDGSTRLISPRSEHLHEAAPEQIGRFGVYQQAEP